MTKTEPDRCRSNLRQSIPWYLNGTLSDAETALVREHIEGCADCRADVELHSDVQAAVLGRAVTPIVPKSKAADIIDIGRTGFARPSRVRRLVSQPFAVAAGIAIIGVALSALFFAQREIEDGNQVFETATSKGATTNIDYVLQLRFDDDVSERQRGEVVQQLEGVVKWSRSDDGVYEIHVRLAQPSLAILEQYELRADSIPGVESAEFTALQLPMR